MAEKSTAEMQRRELLIDGQLENTDSDGTWSCKNNKTRPITTRHRCHALCRQDLTSFSAFFFFAEDSASTSPEWLKQRLSTPVVRLRTERSGLGQLSLRQDSSYTLTTPDADLGRGEGERPASHYIK